MAPKRSKKVVGTVVKTRKKVVQETLEVNVHVEDSELQQKITEVVVEEKGADCAPVVVVLHTEKDSKDKATTTREEQGGQKQDKEKNEGVIRENEKRKRKRKKKKRGSNVGVASGGYKTYVYRVLKQVHPGMGASAGAMSVIEGMMRDMFERIVEEAAQLSKYTGKMTLTSREIQDAVRLVLPGELGKHAIAEGIKSVTSYMDAVRKG